MIRKKIEWTRIWCENTDSGLPRILSVGDSITDAYSQYVRAALAERYSAAHAVRDTISPDGVHYTEPGSRALAARVADCLTKLLKN